MIYMYVQIETLIKYLTIDLNTHKCVRIVEALLCLHGHCNPVTDCIGVCPALQTHRADVTDCTH